MAVAGKILLDKLCAGLSPLFLFTAETCLVIAPPPSLLTPKHPRFSLPFRPLPPNVTATHFFPTLPPTRGGGGGGGGGRGGRGGGAEKQICSCSSSSSSFHRHSNLGNFSLPQTLLPPPPPSFLPPLYFFLHPCTATGTDELG